MAGTMIQNWAVYAVILVAVHFSSSEAMRTLPKGRRTICTLGTYRDPVSKECKPTTTRCSPGMKWHKLFKECRKPWAVPETTTKDDKWSEWSDWKPCSVTCGSGTKKRSRACNNPPPDLEGRPCLGAYEETSICNTDDCPVDGVWSEWSVWSQCSETCGPGTQQRTRDCNNPAPSDGGKPCNGSHLESAECNLVSCPVAGVWLEWTGWSNCSASCGPGTKERTRVCEEPKYGGDACNGSSIETSSCSNTPCSSHGAMDLKLGSSAAPGIEQEEAPETVGRALEQGALTASAVAASYSHLTVLSAISVIHLLQFT